MPWARPGSGFTLLFEALVMSMAGALPGKTLAGRIGAQDTRIWRMIHHYVDEARARGYRTNTNLIAMIYLLGARLKFHLPT